MIWMPVTPHNIHKINEVNNGIVRLSSIFNGINSNSVTNRLREKDKVTNFHVGINSFGSRISKDVAKIVKKNAIEPS